MSTLSVGEVDLGNMNVDDKTVGIVLLQFQHSCLSSDTGDKRTESLEYALLLVRLTWGYNSITDKKAGIVLLQFHFLRKLGITN